METHEVQALLDQWLVYARDFAIQVASDNPGSVVSVNDLYTGMCTSQLPPPPDVPVYKRGHVLSRVFTESSMFHKTEHKVCSINPVQKRRKVCVWMYLPENDTRTVAVSRKSPWDRGGKGW